MKVFVVAAVLVACVAGQSLDRSFNRDLISRKGLSTFNRPSNYYYYGGDYSHNMINTDYSNKDYLPSIYDQIFGGDVDYSTPSTTDYMNVLSYEEMTMHPLFREYLRLPLFRQFWSYPMFQRYVCSHYFQRYWTMPAFQQYFMEPALFYKFIYPIVQLFKYEQTSMNTYTGVDMISGGNRRNFYPFVGGNYYNQERQQQYFGNGIPTVCYTNSMYCRSLVQNLYNHMIYSSKMMTPESKMMTPESMMTPTSGMEMNDVYKYNPYFGRMMYPTMYNNVYNKEFQNFEVPRNTIVNDEFIRQVLSTSANKAMIGDKTVHTMPVDQIIKA